MAKSRSVWEQAILEAVERLGGVASLHELYTIVPTIKSVPEKIDWKHTIRAYLLRLHKIKKRLRRVGLGLYALSEFPTEVSIYEQLEEGKDPKNIFENIPEDQIHSSIEGMLIELGNMYGYATYTDDPSAMFNGKPLSSLATLNELSSFSLPEIVEQARRIDVIWLRRNFPKHTFDVEKTPEFKKALLRAYQLQDLRTSFYFLAFEKHRHLFEKFVNLEPFANISHHFYFRPFEMVFHFYELTVKIQEIRETFLVEPD